MDKQQLLDRIKNMIVSSTKEPKYISLSTVKLADLFDVEPQEIEKDLKDLVNEGKLKKDVMEGPPHGDIYLLP
ncbi:MAG: hypothetical protein ACO1OC_01855 [Tuberibacillus sp.]